MARRLPVQDRSEPFLRGFTVRRDESWDASRYPFNLPAVAGLTDLELDPRITIFVGENGSGKSTLLEAIAVAAGINPEGGSKFARFSTEATHSSLGDFITLHRTARRERDGYFLRAESLYNVATYVGQVDPSWDAYGRRSLHEQSHGESFLALVAHRFGEDGLYLMDEPEAALSPVRQLSMLAMLHDRIELRGCQIVMATHSPILLAYPGALLLSFDSGRPERVAYEELEHVQVTRAFLNKPERFLREIFERA